MIQMTRSKFSRLAGAALFVLSLALVAPALANPGSGGGGGGGSSGGGSSNGGGNSAMEQSTPTLANAQADVDARNWKKAIADLKAYLAEHGSSSEGYNLLAYAYRNLGQYDLAGRLYAKALSLNPSNTGALEYQGILFIKLGQTAKARANLSRIEKICGNTSCEDYTDLAKALG
jgi:tetratricopeptide (TPR) repeat protein